MLNNTLSLSGRMAKKFLELKISPILILLSLFLGLYALIYTPAEEDPQINITLIDIITHYNGAEPKEVEKRISIPMENIISKVKGIKNIYSTSKASESIVSIEFELHKNRNEAISDVYAAVFEQYDRLSLVSAIEKPVIKVRTIDDVPILSYVLYSSSFSLEQITNLAHSIKSELYQYKEIREIEVKSPYERAVRLILDTSKMAKFEVNALDISRVLKEKNLQIYVGDDVRNNLSQQLWVGSFIDKNHLKRLKSLVLKDIDGYTLRLQDVCVDISYQNNMPSSYQHYILNNKSYNCVNITITKESGSSAIDLAKVVDKKVLELRKKLSNDEVEIDQVRNYGKTAQDKVTHLSQKLLVVIVIVMILVLFSMGMRAAIVVALATLSTLSLTLFLAYMLGFTFNQVSLFALIFSIGILVDDAIVVVENVYRRQDESKEFSSTLIINAVNEVGKPTIIATLAVIITLLPMAFISGLMGPYMSPIPINASIGMALSLVVAFSFTPWMIKKIGFKPTNEPKQQEGFSGFFVRLNLYFMENLKRKIALIFALSLGVVFSFYLIAFGWVNLKMLPHDNKLEIQVIVDADENVPLEKTDAILQKIAYKLQSLDGIKSIQVYSGVSSAINFNGLIRQYYFRKAPYLGELVISLYSKNNRDKSSHEIATIMRQEVASIIDEYNVSIKVVEVPPGPPLMSPIVAEIYANNSYTQESIASKVVQAMKDEKIITDIDSSINADVVKKLIYVDEEKARRYNISPEDILYHISALMGKTIAYIHNEQFVDQLPIIMSVEDHKKNLEYILQTKINTIFLREIVHIESSLAQKDILHKNLRAVAYVYGDVKSKDESPLYALFSLSSHIVDVEQYFFSIKDEVSSFIKYDGEFKITMDTFRDMAVAYLIGLFFLYLLLVMQYKSYTIPLIIMSPIALTIIGVVPGHLIFNAPYTATSMIGMIALAGIIVRNSVLLVDFIERALDEGEEIKLAITKAIQARTRPILITATTSMLGAFFILSDPVFEGMAISLIFGVLISTLLTLLVIPLLYSMLVTTHKAKKI